MKGSKGFITAYTLVFGSLLLVMLGGIFGFVLFELKRGKAHVAWSRSLQVSEASMDRYKWCLNNGVEDNCTGSYIYNDLDGNAIGESLLNITKEVVCDEDGLHHISSTGWDVNFPNESREIRATLGKISVAKYSYLLDDNVWAGSDREIRGLYHSNGGIRMDGGNQSMVTSSRSDWLCTSSFGCDSGDCPDDCVTEGGSCRCPGVFTTTANSSIDLFDYPAPYFDFDGITIELGAIKNLVIGYPETKYWPSVSSIDPNGDGYHLVLRDTGDVEVRIITSLGYDYAYSEDDGWHYDYLSIENEYLYSTVSMDEGCPVIFLEDDVWIDGDVVDKIIIVSADLSSPTNDTNVILVDDINYVGSGPSGLTLVAEDDMLISPDSPNEMELHGVFVAQKGHFSRNYYYYSNIRDRLEISGSIISKGRVGTQWTSGSIIMSGYRERENYIDTNLVYSPPPFTPSVSDEFTIFNWEEVSD